MTEEYIDKEFSVKCSINVPEHIRFFDADKPFLNIREEEIQYINSYEKSAIHSTVLNRLRLLISYDYHNFVNSPYGQNILSVLANPRLLYGDIQESESFNMIINSFIGHIKNSVEEIKSSTFRNYRNVADVFSYEELIRKQLYTKLCNNLHKIWRQNYCEYLIPFFATRYNPNYSYIKVSCLTFDNDEFLKGVINYLYKSEKKCRSELYTTILILSVMHDMSVGIGHRAIDKIMSLFNSKRRGNGKCQAQWINSYIADTEPSSTLIDWDAEETAEILATLRGQDKRTIEEKQKYVDEINRRYHSIDENSIPEIRWIRSQALTLFGKPTMELLSQEQLIHIYTAVKRQLVSKSKYSDDVDIMEVPAPDCYIGYLLDYDDPVCKIEIDVHNTLIEDILYLLFRNSNKGVLRLLQIIYLLNYIKDRIGPVDEVSPERAAIIRTIDKVLEYIQFIFTDDCRANVVSEQELKTIFREILSYNKISSELNIIKPRNFEGGFNLNLTYNIIGLLHNLGYFKKAVSLIDKEIANDNQKRNPNFKIKERRKAIETWKSDLDKNIRKHLEEQYRKEEK